MKANNLPKNKWIYKHPAKHVVDHLSKVLNISEIISTVLVQRGIVEANIAYQFLHPSLEYLKDPFLLNSMDIAVNRIRDAVKNRERILICGDYDVDGITSATLLKKVLTELDLDVFVYLPNRLLNGYGFHFPAVEIASQKKASLIITVDCGISSHDTVIFARSKGIDVIITDHHEPVGSLPDALAVINPKREDSFYPDRDLAGIGVAFKLTQALIQKKMLNFPLNCALELVALGTVADVAPLVNENRNLVYFGLEALTHTRNPGLKALKRIAGIRNNQRVDSKAISYQLGPRINAVGRLGSPEDALKLLLTQSDTEASELALKMDKLNQQRHSIEEKIMSEALDQIANVNLNEKPFIVVWGNNWHEGVIGIVASKISDKFYRPTCIISTKGGIGRGSGRSIPDFSLFECLNSVNDLLMEYGGHHVAAGFQILEKNIESFQDACNMFTSQNLSQSDLSSKTYIDAELPLSQITFPFLRKLQQLKPFGLGNPTPHFLFKNLSLKYAPRRVGFDGNHLKMVLTDGSKSIDAIAFGFGKFIDEILFSSKFDIVAYPEINIWHERETLQLNIIDIAPI